MVRQIKAGVKASPSQWRRFGGDPYNWRTMRTERSRQPRSSRDQRIAGHAQAEKTERVGERQRPGRVAHDENGANVKARGVFQRRDGVAVVGIGVVDKLVACGPVGDEVAGTGLTAGPAVSEDWQ